MFTMYGQLNGTSIACSRCMDNMEISRCRERSNIQTPPAFPRRHPGCVGFQGVARTYHAFGEQFPTSARGLLGRCLRVLGLRTQRSACPRVCGANQRCARSFRIEVRRRHGESVFRFRWLGRGRSSRRFRSVKDVNHADVVHYNVVPRGTAVQMCLFSFSFIDDNL